MKLYSGRFRIDSTRLPNWDYASTGWYFVTICTKALIPFFGNIRSQKVSLSHLGTIAHQYWRNIPNHHIVAGLDDFIIMPNHIHGIVILNSAVETLHATSLHNFRHSRSESMGEISPKSGSLGAIVRSYKAAVTRWARRNDYPYFAWQSRYYDHIIRNDTALDRIRRYIRDNPRKYTLDSYHHDKS